MKCALLSVTSCALVVALGVACVLELARRSQAALSLLVEEGWEATRAVWASAWSFASVILFLLLALAVVLVLLEVARICCNRSWEHA